LLWGLGLFGSLAVVTLTILAARHVWWSGNASESSMPELDPKSTALRKEALDAAERLVTEYPRQAAAFYSKALVCRRFGDREAATACWKRCLDLDPGFALAYYCLGRDALDQGESAEGIELLRNAVKLDIEMPDAYLRLADGLMASGAMEEAIGPLEALVRRVPTSSEGLCRLGWIHLDSGDCEEAKRYYLRALEVDPTCFTACYGLASVCKAQGEDDQADQYRNQFAELNQANLERSRHHQREYDDDAQIVEGVAFALTNVSKVHSAFGDLVKAEGLCRRAAELRPNDVESRKEIALICANQGRTDEAISALKQLCKIEPDNVSHYLDIGALSMRTGDLAAAERAYRQAQQVKPESHMAYAALAGLYLKSGVRQAEAMELAQKAVKLAPLPENYYLLGLVQQRCGDRDKALESLRQAIELDSSNSLYREAYQSIAPRP
jgi:tetratricopeptide (TPR) repeat protein